MADTRNFLIGYGERLIERAVRPPRGNPTPPPYGLGEAVSRVSRMARSASQVTSTLPSAACPSDMAVAVVTVHPQHTSKSAYPSSFFESTGGVALGSRPTRIKPDKWTRKGKPEEVESTQLFVAWRRADLDRLPATIAKAVDQEKWVEDLQRLESVRAATVDDRLKVKTPVRSEVLLEVGIHSPADRRFTFVLDAFLKYAKGLGGKPDVDRCVYTGGLCFMPVRID